MKDYHDLYLKSEVLLLADVFGKFRNNSLKNYGFSRRHYLSAPALGLDAILNITKVELDLISDPDMHISLKKVQEVEFFIFLLDIVKPTKSI